jgi:hypothetical protein
VRALVEVGAVHRQHLLLLLSAHLAHVDDDRTALAIHHASRLGRRTRPGRAASTEAVVAREIVGLLVQRSGGADRAAATARAAAGSWWRAQLEDGCRGRKPAPAAPAAEACVARTVAVDAAACAACAAALDTASTTRRATRAARGGELVAAIVDEFHVVRACVQHLLELARQVHQLCLDHVDDAARVGYALFASAPGGGLGRRQRALQAGELTVELGDLVLDDIHQLIDLGSRILKEAARLRELRQLAQLARSACNVCADGGRGRRKFGASDGRPRRRRRRRLPRPPRRHDLVELERAIHHAASAPLSQLPSINGNIICTARTVLTTVLSMVAFNTHTY